MYEYILKYELVANKKSSIEVLTFFKCYMHVYSTKLSMT